MRNVSVLIGIGAVVILFGLWMINQNFTNKTNTEGITGSGSSMTETLTLTSLGFENGTSLPARFTCDGENMSPPLSWSGVPAGAKSLALIMDDPDAGRTGWV